MYITTQIITYFLKVRKWKFRSLVFNHLRHMLVSQYRHLVLSLFTYQFCMERRSKTLRILRVLSMAAEREEVCLVGRSAMFGSIAHIARHCDD